MNPAAVIFDCDGVLVDSEPHSVSSWLEVLSSLGHPATATDIYRCIGLGYGPTRDALAALGPLPTDTVLWPRLLAALSTSYRRGLIRFVDATLVLSACDVAGVPVAVATASPRERLDLTLESSHLEARFVASVAGDEVAHAKPAPDVYLRAAELLGVDPTGCVAIEDTSIGVRAALAAGMKTVAVVRAHGDRVALERAGGIVVDEITPGAVGLG